ncbi:hypothetical protein ABW19_dt0207893 [Dactylella cylindrospora]|nr:hypothetical protein ABW19_dt0207893 [Dactylella cylindrospora]
MPYLEHDPTDMNSFRAHLQKSKRILALCGAGTSYDSGMVLSISVLEESSLANTHDHILGRDQYFRFICFVRHAAFSAKPNAAHYALAAASINNKEFITVTQNVDGLSPRAGHPADQLYPIHGSLSTVKCSSFFCSYVEHNNFKMALTPALAPPSPDQQETDLDAQPSQIPIEGLPHCPKCKTGLMRPGVVWFGESLPNELLHGIDDWINKGPVDLCLVIGTSGRVWPAAGYSEQCKLAGAKVAIINLEISSDPDLGGVSDADWTFEGDCAAILPEILKPAIGDIDPIIQTLSGQDKFPPLTSTGGPLNSGPTRSGEGSGYY